MRGRRWGKADFPGKPEQTPEAFWHPTLNPDGLFDLRLMKDLSVVTAAGVGGGSLVYANVQLRAPAEVFMRGWPRAISRTELDRHYTRTEEALMPEEVPEELPKMRAFVAAGHKVGRRHRTPATGGATSRALATTRSAAYARSGAQTSVAATLAAPIHAKNTVDITYIARAEQHGAEVRTHRWRAHARAPDRG